MRKRGYVYIMASESGTLYIGVTSNLLRRVFEHKNGIHEGFTKKYKCHRLVYYECGDSIVGAIAREKEIKKWRRDKKQSLIHTINPKWVDLTEELYEL